MNKLSTTILAIETSCDDTAISIVKEKDGHFDVLANEISSQTRIHAEWGGVVPNLAAREHKKNILPLLNKALKISGLSPLDISLIAVTQGPGLIPALLIGTSVAKTLAYLWNKPLIGIHHVEGHIYANFVTDSKLRIASESTKKFVSDVLFRSALSDTNFPVLCLVVSGGHTQLVLMKDHLQYEIIGQTLDDAAGEAFDKVARILDIGYPGGPSVALWATKFKMQKSKCKISFPRPMLNKNNFDFSFSGLKTAVLYETKKHPDSSKDEEYIAEVCHEFQQAVVDVLVQKTLKAATEFEAKTIMLAGGVSANNELREQLGEAIKENLSDGSYLVPDLTLTGDNATMIATAAHLRWKKMSATEKEAAKNNWKTLVPDANLKLQ